ncbi:hypothetical protein [uncultured Algoriphagus sp.]|uniref:hypothetical protein n=1 Tax=uncultured Algoriphagus sp. TaxID=417365 RepID=UPI0030EBFC21|tara:strand:- start:360 stop:665 length:306 start_codon:yes stop_codon:yes gene_type:complete
MKSLDQNTYLLSEEEAICQIHDKDPILKVNLYGENLQEGSWKTIYLRVICPPKLRILEFENSIRRILRKYSKKTLAFNYELLNSPALKKKLLLKEFKTSMV